MDKEFEKNFDFESEDLRSEYFEYCSLYSSFGKNKRKSGARRYKQIFYFLFLLALPLRIPYTPLIYVAAVLCSIMEKKAAFEGTTSGSLLARIFIEEEPMNLALLLMLLFSSGGVKIVLYICLLIWAFLMWCEWGQEMLEES